MGLRGRQTKRLRWVVKIGSALLTNQGAGLARENVRPWVEQMIALRDRHIDVILVSSGAIAEGMNRLGWLRRPQALYELQAAAAVGQMGLVQVYESCFQRHGVHTAQILLTHEDLASRKRYLNARSTLWTLLELGVVPVVNENDTVSMDEIRLGDNDNLAGMVANLVEADRLVLLTDQAGLFDKDPRLHAQANLLTTGEAGDPELEAVAGDSGLLGQGGMRTKLHAATRAARSGTTTVIAHGHEPDVLVRISKGEMVGTRLNPGQRPLAARKRWLAGHMHLRGSLRLDDGAVKVLRHSGRSLLPVGVKAYTGAFSRGDVVACVDEDNTEIARGIVNYDAGEVHRIMGKASERIADLLGYVDEPELIHRDNLVLIN